MGDNLRTLGWAFLEEEDMSAMRGFGIFYVLLAIVLAFGQVGYPAAFLAIAGLLMVLFDIWLEKQGASSVYGP